MTEEELLRRIKERVYNMPPHQARDWILDGDAALQEEGISVGRRRRLWNHLRRDALQRLEERQTNGRPFLYRQIAGTIAKLLQDLHRRGQRRSSRGKAAKDPLRNDTPFLQRMWEFVGWS